MDDARRIRQLTPTADDVAKFGRLHEAYESHLSSRPKVRAARVLSLNSVLDDMRAILWCDSREQRNQTARRDRPGAGSKTTEVAAGIASPNISQAK